MRTPLIAGNWKMFKTVAETVKYIAELRELVAGLSGVEIVIAPPFTSLQAAAEAARGSSIGLRIGIAAQDLYWEREGAFTGAISPLMIADAGATWVIVGHSERRTLFGETDATVNRKCAAAFAAGLTPIACIGETLDQRERGETFDVLDRQIRNGLDGLTAEQMARLVIAYEPVWAIGTGRNATPAQAGEAHGHIRQRLRQWFGIDAADQCRLLYGGSVKPGNIAELGAQADVDGALVGGASLDAKGFAEIVSRGRKGAV
jgi:triosephosphate isomerase